MVQVYLLDANGDFIPGSDQQITFVFSPLVKSTWRELIVNAMGAPYNADPWPLPDGAAALYYKVLSGPGVRLGRDAVFPRVSGNTVKFSGQSLSTNNVEILFPGDEGFLGKVRA